jgi:hypothetical protein
MTGPSRDRPARPSRGTGSGGRNEGRCRGDYDDLALEVDDSDFFFEPDDDDEPSEFFDSDFDPLFDPLSDDDELSDFAPSLEPLSEDDSDLLELPFARLAPLRLSFL